jgi:hypothetical protein
MNFERLPKSSRKSYAAEPVPGHSEIVNEAEFVVITARTAGSQRDGKGVGVFVVPANANGVDISG